MTATTEPRGGLDLGWISGEDGWGDAMNANLLRLSRLGFHPSVLSATTTAPPGSPISGSGYIIPSGATGAWVGKTGQVAVWDGAAWAYAVPRDGWTIHVDGAGLTTYDGGTWSQANVATAIGVGAEPSIIVGTAAQYWSGLKSWVDFATSVRTSVLTGLSLASSAVVAATDSVLAAIGKLQAQVSLRLTIANPEYTGNLYGSGAHVWRSGGDYSFGLISGAVDWAVKEYDDGGGAVAYPIVVKRGVGQEIQLGYSGGLRPVRIGGAITNTELAGTGSRPLVATSLGLIGTQDASTFLDTIGAVPRSTIISAGQLSGFADKDNVEQRYNEATRVVTNYHPSGFVDIVWRGKVVASHASPWALPAHPATLNKTYFYYSADGTNYAWSETAWDFDDIQVASIEHGTYLKLPIRECHGLADPEWHRDAHKHIWTYVQSGCGLTAGTYARGGTASDANNTPGVDAGILRDEDLPTALAALTQGSYRVCIPTSGEFNVVSSNFPFTVTPGDFIRYFPADTGIPTTGATGKFYNVYLVGAPLMLTETGAPHPNRFLWIAPQAQYNSIDEARGEVFETDLRLGDLASGVSEYCPIRRLIFGSSASYATTGKVRFEDFDDLERSPLRSSSPGASTISGSGVAGLPTVWASPSSLTSQDAATFRATIEAFQLTSLSGAVDLKSVNGGAPGAYRIEGSSYSNGWTGIVAGQDVSLLQLAGGSGLISQLAMDHVSGDFYNRAQGEGFPGDGWGAWTKMWDAWNLPVGTTGRAVLATTTQAAARSAIGLAQIELLIHSDFGRSATTDGWQSAFTNNAASGLQLAANSTSSGTEIIIEQVVDIPVDGGASAYQVYIGTQLTGEDSPTGATYADVIDPNTEYGAGKIQIRIELIGSGTSIIGYVSSRVETRSSNATFVRVGQITVNGTIANSIDVRFNPDTQTNYIIRRNRVFRRNP